MQCAVIEFARDVLGLEDANSTEFDQTTDHPVIGLMPDQQSVRQRGGTMRLGSWPCALTPEWRAREAYGFEQVDERHRHRYEFNREYEDCLTAAGLRITGETPDNTYVEICEIAGHPWYLGCQFHPEFKSKPMEPHPLFKAFIGAAQEFRKNRLAAADELRSEPQYTRAH